MGLALCRPSLISTRKEAPGNMAQINPDVQFMKKALRQAAFGAGMTSPNPLVGAVIVNKGAIVGEGYHQALGGPHAEVNAIRAAGAAAPGGTLYVTLEPCNHHGLTPPCTKAIIDAGISRVVFGMRDPNPDVAGSGCENLRAAGIEVNGGVLEAGMPSTQSALHKVRNHRSAVCYVESRRDVGRLHRDFVRGLEVDHRRDCPGNLPMGFGHLRTAFWSALELFWPMTRF